MKCAWLVAGLTVAAGLALVPSPAAAEKSAESGQVVREVRRVSPTETSIIYRDSRPKAARKKAASTPAQDFKVYDLAPARVPAPAIPPAAYGTPVYAAPVYPAQAYPAQAPVETWSQVHAPGPNTGMAAGAGRSVTGTTLSLSAPYGYGGYWGGYPYHPGGGLVGPGPVVVNTYQFPYPQYNPYLSVPYVSPYPSPAVPSPYGIRPQVTVYPAPAVVTIP